MLIRDYTGTDAGALGRVAVSAFAQYQHDFNDWGALAAGLKMMPELAHKGEILVAEHNRKVVGAVAYIPPHAAKAHYFNPAWPIIRMLVVEPQARGLGIGRKLTEACIEKAKRDESPVIALHTSPVMTVALAMYLRMGFQMQFEAPPIYGVPYNVYVKTLD